MQIGIVGSSKIKENDVLIFVKNILNKFTKNTVIITGGAKGVDTAVKQCCDELGYICKEIFPKSNNWEGFKERNLQIAKESDHVISIALPYSKQFCYHCNSKTHEKTAGCYTGKHCKSYEVMIFER